MMEYLTNMVTMAGGFLSAHAGATAGIGMGALVLLILGMNVIPTCYLKFVKSNELRGGDKNICLTFDDGPDPEYTPPLLDLLQKNHVRATFFVLAEKADRHPEIVDRMIAEGHQVAFHALSHRNLWGMGPRSTRRNFYEGLALLRRNGWEPRWYRPPFGNVTPWALSECRKNGLELRLWSVMAQDWRGDHDETVILRKLRERVRAGSVICLHDSGEGSAAPGQPERTMRALAVFLPEMREKGYEFVLPDQGGASADGKTVHRNALKRIGGVQ